MTNQQTPKEKVNEKLKELVIAKIKADLPQNIRLCVGSEGSLTKEEMIKHVQAGDDQGKEIIKMHVNFIGAVTSGALLKELNAV